ncbi:hypothetical protein SDC9_13046 [bioreactor metagenome]|uniref:NAD-specific glutamate dehydrogenase n=1 Tax=bioreactor metagenome TaxID=1076179 RepID=A0A644TK39_9ZZZZ
MRRTSGLIRAHLRQFLGNHPGAPLPRRQPPRPGAANAGAGARAGSVVHLQRRDEGRLRNLDLAELPHLLLAGLLLFQQLLLPGGVAAIALCRHVLAHRAERLARHDPATDRRLDRDLEHVPRDQLFQLLHHRPAARLGAVAVHHDRQRIDRLVVHQDRHLDHEILAVFAELVVEGGIALRHRFQPVVEVEHHLGERQVIDHHRARAGIGQIELDAAAVLAQLQHVAQIFVGHHDRRLDPRLLDMVDIGQIGHVGGVVQIAHLAVLHVDLEHHARRGGDQIEVIFALQPVAHHFEVQKTKEAATEAEAERRRGLHLVAERGVVQREFLDRVAQRLEIIRIDREEAAEHHRLRRLEARQRRRAGFLLMGDGVAHTGVAHLLDRGGEDADLARAELRDVDHLRLQHGELVDAVDGAGLHHLDPVALADHPVHDADHHHDAEIGVIPAVDQHRLQRRVAVALRRGQPVHDRLEHLGNAEPGLRRDRDRVRGVDADHILDVRLHRVGIGRRQVDLVQHRHDLVARVDRLIDVRQRLRLDALARVDDQQRALDCAHAPADLIGEVDVAGGVDQVQDIGLAILRRIFDADGVRLDGDAAFALDIHAVEHLRLHVTRGHRPGQLDEPVGERGFTVVDMRHDGEVADVIELGHGARIAVKTGAGKRDCVPSPAPSRAAFRPGLSAGATAARRAGNGQWWR